VLLSLNVRDHVVATGGSAAYSGAAMRHLKANGTVVYLRVDLAVLERRVDNFGTRGIARRPDQTFAELFAERSVLYRRYADLTIECGEAAQEALARKIRDALRACPGRTRPRED
jgi:shikimate kinase